jgi:Ca2+/H+ antiporter, TMEM165/GDT1 family
MQVFAVIGVAFALTFLAELPDKSMFALLVLGTRYRAAGLWIGAAGAFTLHMGFAVTAGQLLSLAPHRVVDAIVAGLFLAGSAYLLWLSIRGEPEEAGLTARQGGPRGRSVLRAAGAGFGLVFLAEWGDITQVTAANLAVRYNPLLVFVGATLGLWATAAIVINVGGKSLSVIPKAWVQRITAAILAGFGAYAVVAAIAG